MKSPITEGAKVLGLVVAPVLGLRAVHERVLYLSDYLAFVPGDLFLSLAVGFATDALNKDPQENFFLSDTGKNLLWATGLAVGAALHANDIRQNKHDRALLWAPSQVAHQLLSFGAGIRFVGGSILPMLGTKRSMSKALALAFLTSYVICFVIDATDPPSDFYLSERQMQRRIIDWR